MRKRKASTARKASFFIILAIIACLVTLAITGLTIGSTSFVKSAKQIRTGIDIRGGVNATFVPAEENVVPTEQQLESARSIFETRLDSKGILDYSITTDNENHAVIVEFPWKADEENFDAQAAINELGATANLTFCTLKKDSSGNLIDADGNSITSSGKDPVADEVLLTGKDIKSSSAQYQEGSYVVALEFTDEGSKLFESATTKQINDYLGIFLDDQNISYPTVNSTISDGKAVIQGNFTLDSAKDLAAKINAGALPYAMTSSSYSAVSATMGTKALSVMLYAGLLTVIIVCLFMLIMYRVPGFVACLNLLTQVSIQLLIFANFNLTLTLPGIAGIILSVGMCVDSNVIISERIREEMRKGKSLIGAIESGYDRTLTAICDCNVTTAIVALLLILFGTGSVLSFGYTLLIGIILSFVVSVLVSKLTIKSLSSYNCMKNPKFYGYKEVQNND